MCIKKGGNSMDEKMTMEEIQELVNEKQYTRLRQEIIEWNEADIAAVIAELPHEECLRVFRILPKGIAADVFAYLPIETEQDLITTLTDREAINIVNNLMADDAADLMEEMPAGVVKKLLANADPEVRRDINHLLRYPEDSAGSIMTVEFVDLKENLTVQECIDRIRRIGINSETIEVCYVLDLGRHLIGTVSLRDLLIHQSDVHVIDFMNDNVISVNTMTDQEEVARLFQKYDFTSMPVVDNEGRLVGIITIDDVVDILQEEATEDIEKMAAILPTDKPYMKTGVFETWKKRIPWLLLLMISATITGKIITHYEDALGTYVVLTAFIPMLMDTGGNAGGQASVTIIRGLSLDDIEWGDLFKVVWKEIRVAVCCGITLSIASFLKIVLLDHVSVGVTLVVCLTLLVVILLAKIVGCTLPMIAQKIGFDPAVMASPFITTIVDALSLMIYFKFATMILNL